MLVTSAKQERLTLCRTQVLLPAVALSIALLHHWAVLDVMLFCLAASLTNVTGRWWPRPTGTLELPLRAFADEVFGLIIRYGNARRHSQICRCYRRIQVAVWRGPSAPSQGSPESSATNISFHRNQLSRFNSRRAVGRCCKHNPLEVGPAPSSRA